MLKQIIDIMNDPKENENYNPKFKLILTKIIISFEGYIVRYLKSDEKIKERLYNEILNAILYLYIIMFNIKSPEKMILFFNTPILLNLLKRFLEVFKDIDGEDEEDDDEDENNVTKGIKLSHFMLNICFDDIKRKIFLSGNDELMKIYQNNVYGLFLGIFPSSNERFRPNKKYCDFIKDIIELKLDYYINNLKGENSEIFCRNLIPILLTNKEFDFISFYIYVVKKHIEIIRKSYNNELTSLFRADDFTNDLIKNLILIFGNDSFMISFYSTLPKEYLSINDIEFDLDIFENFLHKFLEKLAEKLPYIIRILLKIVHICVKDLNETKDSYNVIYTILIFNFFISPTTLDLFGISMVKYKSLRQLTRILRNIFFGKEFDTNDKLSYFNKKVEIFHNYINDQFNIILEGIDIEKDKIEINKKINNILAKCENNNTKNNEENNIIFLPTFCYQYYWKNILKSINGLPNVN